LAYARLSTWAPVPPARQTDRKPLEPSNFERWSLLEELPASARSANARRYNARVKAWSARQLGKLDTSVISKSVFDAARLKILLTDARELHYSTDDATHAVEPGGRPSPTRIQRSANRATCGKIMFAHPAPSQALRLDDLLQPLLRNLGARLAWPVWRQR